jgi:outer membrane protein assembly factor BamB
MKNKFSTKLKTTATITLILLMASVTLLAMPNVTVKAQTLSQPVAGALPVGANPSITITSTAYLAVNPNPIGVGQELLINMWNQPPINVARDFENTHLVTITKPDGTVVTYGPVSSYAGDGTAWFTYVPDAVGTWKFKYDFLGMYYPAAYYYQGKVVANGTSGATYLDSAYYKPAITPEVSVTVQADFVSSYPPAALPTDYWTRPVSPNNREWRYILGNWPATGMYGSGEGWPANTNAYMSNYRFAPYVQAPGSAHILWKQQGAIGGLIGGKSGQLSFTGAGVIPTIIFAGRCYASVSVPPDPVYINGTWQYPSAVSAVTKWRCFDLRTGDIYWERPVASGETLPTILTYEPGGPEVPGAEAQHTDTVYLVALIGASGSNPGRIIKYNAWTGVVAANITAQPTGVGAATYYRDPWVLSIQTIGSGSSAKYRLINWTIANNAGTEVIGIGGGQPTIQDFNQRIWGNISWPFSSIGTVDYESGIAVTTGTISSTGTGVGTGVFVQAASLTTGALLWNVTNIDSNNWATFFGTPGVADHGKFAERMMTGEWWAWDLNTGKIVWKSPRSSWPWGVFGAYDVQSAYGYIFDNGYDGVHAINWTNGHIDWSFNAPSAPFETPYNGGFAWHATGYVADGKLYTFTAEHTPSQPITRGLKLYCLNATTGANIWNISAYSGVSGSRAFPGGIADGYLTFASSYDGYMYVFGKGKSATTVTASPKTLTNGAQVLIEGTVLDQSPAQQGTPCVSKDSMTTQMEYLHMQQPIDGIWHNETVIGVPVTLTAINSNGTVINIGTATTNAYYGTFGFAWTPPSEGTYTITASFASDASYGSSGAATSIAVSAAPVATATATPTETPTATPTATPTPTASPSPAPNPETGPSTDMYLIAAAAVIIIVVIAVAAFVLRKRK